MDDAEAGFDALRDQFLARTTPELTELVKHLNAVFITFFGKVLPPEVGAALLMGANHYLMHVGQDMSAAEGGKIPDYYSTVIAMS